MRKVVIWTDGACFKNPGGPGGWAAYLEHDGHSLMIGGGDPATTCNRMEIQAIIGALQRLREPCEVELYTDSKIMISAVEKAKPGYRGKVKPQETNVDLWKQLIPLLLTHRVNTHWVKGHSGIRQNELCDQEAGRQAQLQFSARSRKELVQCRELFLSRYKSGAFDREASPLLV